MKKKFHENRNNSSVTNLPCFTNKGKHFCLHFLLRFGMKLPFLFQKVVFPQRGGQKKPNKLWSHAFYLIYSIQYSWFLWWKSSWSNIFFYHIHSDVYLHEYSKQAHRSYIACWILLFLTGNHHHELQNICLIRATLRNGFLYMAATWLVGLQVSVTFFSNTFTSTDSISAVKWEINRHIHHFLLIKDEKGKWKAWLESRDFVSK